MTSFVLFLSIAVLLEKPLCVRTAVLLLSSVRAVL